jgi:CRISPR-associated protein Cmr3
MNATNYRFLEPLDVLFLRGNKLFGDPGSFGESLIPPWPSVAAGALRSRMLADAGVDLAAFAQGETEHPALGTPGRPGPFALTAFHLARRVADGTVEALLPPPADLFISEAKAGSVTVRRLDPQPLAPGLACSGPTPLLPVLPAAGRDKPAGGYWLTGRGWGRYLAGQTPGSADLVRPQDLWKIDPRVGVGLDPARRRAADGRLFSVQAVAMARDVGFLAGVAGANPPAGGSVRLGGDGRAAAVHRVAASIPEPDYEAIARARRCRLVLTSPGIFAAGWLPTGCTPTPDGTLDFELAGVRGRLVCAAVPRAEVVSGWDLAAWSQGRGGPKPARRAAPAGSVYWLDPLEATAEGLRKLAETGLWGAPCEDPARRAEGFNRLALAAWS